MAAKATKQLIKTLKEIVIRCRIQAQDMRNQGGYSAAYVYTIHANELEELIKEYEPTK